jgi:hypothetical protein
MAPPTRYTRQFNFTNQQALTPTAPLQADKVDAELNALVVTTDQVITNLSLIQRDDGALANGSVGPEQLSATVTLGFGAPTAWAEAQAYTTTSTVTYANKFYVATSAHTSATANRPDQISAPWSELADLASISLVDGSVTTAKLASEAVTAAKIAPGAVATRNLVSGAVDAPVLATDAVTTVKILNANVTTAKIADANVTTAKIADANVTTAKIADDAVTYAKLQNVSAQNRLLARYSASAGDVEEATLGAGVSFVAGALSVAGRVAQIVTTATGALQTVTTTIPFDDSIPQQTGEGTEVLSRTITPSSASSTLVIDVVISCASSATADVIAALFQDSTANALAATSFYIDSAGGRANIRLQHTMTAGTTSSTTFKVRVGPGSASNVDINGNSAGARVFGGVAKTAITITEILP